MRAVLSTRRPWRHGDIKVVSKGDKRGLWVSSNVETMEESVGAAVRYFPSVVEAVVE